MTTTVHTTTRLPSTFAPYARAAHADARLRCFSARSEAIGASVEGRPIVAHHFGDLSPKAPVVLLTSLVHGVEAIGLLSLVAAIEAMVRADDGALATAHVIAVPVVNPDGLAHNLDALARGDRASRRGNARSVDLNRNFPIVADRIPSHPFAGSTWRHSPHYRGKVPVSEPEVQAIVDLARQHRPALSIGFHSFGELLLFPYAHTDVPHPDRARYERLGRAFARAQKNPYRVQPSLQLYPTIGDLDDWLDHELGTLAFTVEVGRPTWASLRDGGILQPFSWMNPIGERAIEAAIGNVVPGVRALVDASLRELGRTKPTRDESIDDARFDHFAEAAE